MDLDSAFKKFEEILADVGDDLDSVETEQDARFRIINRMLTEVLGWEFKEIKTEKKNDSGFSDYLLSHASKARAIVEAKKVGTPIIATKSKKVTTYKLYGPAMRPAVEGIQQARDYCVEESVDLAILTSGTTWAGFLALRTDGKKIKDGKAIAFPTLESVRDNFGKFWDLFSREGVISKLYRVAINEAEGFSLSPSEPLFVPIEQSTIKLAAKSDLARDLEEVFESFFSAMSGDDDPDMLRNCFVESKESKQGDKTLSKITADLISHLEVISGSTGGALGEEVARAVKLRRGEKVLIIGNKGAGKSTFVDRFFHFVLDSHLKKKCVLLKIDLAQFPGDENVLALWITHKLKEKIEEKLYGDGSPSYNELLGVFHKDYLNWTRGTFKPLYEKDKNELKIKFGEHMHDVMQNDEYGYCVRQLRNIIKSRKRLPCLVFDNTDQFSPSIQEAVFQYANSLFEEAKLVLLVTPITDKTVWQMSKAGPLQSYPSKAFYLPVPSTKKIIEKRIVYIAKQAEKEKSQKRHYLSKGGLHISIKNLEAFTSCLEEVFLRTEYISRRIGQLSNYEIRRCLKLSKILMTSPLLEVDELVSAFFAKEELNLPRHKILHALLNGPYEYFRQDQSEYVVNLFEIDSECVTSPLLRLSILRLLRDKEYSVRQPLESYVTCGEIETYFEPVGAPPHVVRSHLKVLMDYRLIEPYDPTYESIEPGQSVSLTPCGHIHLEMAVFDQVYFVQMALISGIRSIDLANDLNAVHHKNVSPRKKIDEIKRKFLHYCLEEDQRFLRIPAGHKNYAGQISLREELQGAKPKLGVKAEVIWFNIEKGHGFVAPLDGSDNAYINHLVLEEIGSPDLYSGAKITCDIVKTAKSPMVIKVAEVEAPLEPLKRKGAVRAIVVFYLPEKGFGFLKPENGNRDIYISHRVLSTLGVQDIASGTVLQVETEMEIEGPVAKSVRLVGEDS